MCGAWGLKDEDKKYLWGTRRGVVGVGRPFPPFCGLFSGHVCVGVFFILQ